MKLKTSATAAELLPYRQFSIIIRHSIIEAFFVSLLALYILHYTAIVNASIDNFMLISKRLQLTVSLNHLDSSQSLIKIFI